jgi:hypothetical protein
MTDTVTSSAVVTGNVAAVQERESTLAALFHRDKALLRTDPAVEKALEDVVDTPTIGAIAAVEMARISSGWSAEIGAGNGLAKYQSFAKTLVSSGWFSESNGLASVTLLPAFRLDDPVASILATIAAVYPDLSPIDQRRVCQALIRSLAHNLGPEGIPPEAASDSDLLGKKEVLERRVTTVTSNVLGTGDSPIYAMHWKTEIFERTKEGKDDPKTHQDERTKNHRLVFNLQRWREGDRSVLLDYYRYVDDWLNDFNSSGGRMRNMACFASLMKS